jgi:RNA polymerase sigma-70 factor (ECF subfamily)
MFRRYEPLLQRWSRARLRNPDDAAEVSQIVWCELAQRLVDFEYNPYRSFRGWLRRLHRNRSLDFIKGRKRYADRLERASREYVELLPREKNDDASHASLAREHVEERLKKQSKLVEIQGRVQARVSEQTWRIFWKVVVDNRTVSDVASEYSMRYASAFAAVARVSKMLQDEAQR